MEGPGMNHAARPPASDNAAAAAAQALEQQREAASYAASYAQPISAPVTGGEGNPSPQEAKRAKADAEYLSLMLNPAAIELVRLRERSAYSSAPRIPLYCSGHRTGVALALNVSNEAGEGTPVPDHIEMVCLPDPKAGMAGTADQGQSYTVHCGPCGRSTRRQDAWLLNAALKCLGTTAGSGYRITIT
jgi:hypothetical protein